MADEGGPYREGPHWRECPRCDEILEENFEGSMMCPRCAGSWISQVVFDAAFGDPRWPGGSALWWRRELNCPECSSGGTKSVMDAIETNGVIIDRCAGHGIWFDAGELERVVNVTTDPMSLLRERVEKSRPEMAALRASYDRTRDLARAERAARRQEAERADREAATAARRAEAAIAVEADLSKAAARRLELTLAIAHKEAEIIALGRQMARLESDLAALRDELSELSSGSRSAT